MRESTDHTEVYEPDEFTLRDATVQAELVRRKEVTPLELVDAAIKRIERINPEINAIASTDFNLARERAATIAPEGLFAGVPTLLKDLMSYPGHAVAFGTRMFAGQRAVAGSDYTEALDAAGLIVLGKSATSEFGLLGTTKTFANGATRNPWDTSRSSGGSSGGAAAAVAAGLVPIAHASDGGGSIRGPASFTGLFGFKPTRGRTVSNGMPAEMPTAGLIAEHCVSRSVRDSYHWLVATERRDRAHLLPSLEVLRASSQKRLRIGAYRSDCFGSPASLDAAAALETGINLCRLLGHDVIDVAGPVIDTKATREAFFTLTGFSIGQLLSQVRQMLGDRFDPNLFEPYTLDLVRRAEGVSPETLATLAKAFPIAERAADDALADIDVLLSPTVSMQAFPLDIHGPNQPPAEADDFIARLAGYTVVASLAGWPAMSVPLHRTADGLPIGCHFTAARGRDDMLFSLAFQLEEASHWSSDLISLPRVTACRRN
ncbi:MULTISPECIES: amidase family protein [unclassified Rhizobium]|jgi:amidase|uniref:amidase n=1 Tax=unclassified Rhizobium TaxID=2613769 RepID=UPI00069064C4|nr:MULTISPECIES: amidase family protein [unclassified Rhizobium]MBN8950580.1 amidase [Rhizobium tropici]RKD69322.1 amidase [Rhizobium sp. WW_1]